ncbi:MAG: VPLPA-CTERM sorting domain-containing protein [Gammaproteobacteria bacterium]|nr:VPLPA-CTERM sorting domain-containing protein [Gammaproteobacteria bacterium]
MEKKYSGYCAGVALVSACLSQSVAAMMVDVTGSFDATSLTHTHYIYDRFYNQDNLDPAPVTLPGNLGATTNSVAYFGWGIDLTDSIIQQQAIQSHFWFNGTGSVGGAASASVLSGDTFSLGTFTYTNEQTVFSGGLVQIDFLMDISIEGMVLANTLYRLEIDNTVNSSSTPEDTARLLNPLPDPKIFNLGGVDYQLVFNGFSRDGGLTFETQATLAEGDRTSAEIFATISQVTVVPIPAAVWLFGSGLLALMGLAHRKPWR